MTVQGSEGGPIYHSSNSNTQQNEIDNQKVDSTHVEETMDSEREKNIPKEIDYSRTQTIIDNKVKTMDKTSISSGYEKVAEETEKVANDAVFKKVEKKEAPKLAQKNTTKLSEKKPESEKHLKNDLDNCERLLGKIDGSIGKSTVKKPKNYDHVGDIKNEIDNTKKHINSLNDKKIEKQGFSKHFDELNNKISDLQSEIEIDKVKIFEMEENIDRLVKKNELTQNPSSNLEMEMGIDKLKSSKNDLDEKNDRLKGYKNERSEKVKKYVSEISNVLISKLNALKQLENIKEKNDRSARG